MKADAEATRTEQICPQHLSEWDRHTRWGSEGLLQIPAVPLGFTMSRSWLLPASRSISLPEGFL